MNKLYRLYCETCSYNKVTDGTDINLVEFKTSPVQGSFIKTMLDGKEVITNRKVINQTKRVKCPQCGRVITPKPVTTQLTKKEKEDDEN